MRNYSTQEVIDQILAKGYTFFDEGLDYNLNIIGIRAKSPIVNTFCDPICVIYRDPNSKYGLGMVSFPATTDPGLYYMNHPMMPSFGTAIMVPGQYKGAYAKGLHEGYPALVQQKPIAFYRDTNNDNRLDMDPNKISWGVYGVNIHHAGVWSTQVNNWSAGCLVFSKLADFNIFMELVDKSIALYGNSFSLTLLTEW